MHQALIVLFTLSAAMIGAGAALMTIGLRLSGHQVARIRKKGRLAFVLGLVASLVLVANLVIALGLAMVLEEESAQMVMCIAYLPFAAGCALVAVGMIIAGRGVFKITLRIDPPTGGS